MKEKLTIAELTLSKWNEIKNNPLFEMLYQNGGKVYISLEGAQYLKSDEYKVKNKKL